MIPPSGPVPARIMLVGEAPTYDDVRFNSPFMGSQGDELNRMLHEAGINRNECFCTNVARQVPPSNQPSNFIAQSKKEITSEHTFINGKHVKAPIVVGLNLLKKELSMVQPKVIIAFGNTALWALTGKWGIQRWRGSMLSSDLDGRFTKCIPTIQPSLVLREWSLRAISVQDLRRANLYSTGASYPIPQWNFELAPSATSVLLRLSILLQQLNEGPRLLSFDIETAQGHIDCAGIAWSENDSICIPLRCRTNDAGYWDLPDECAIVHSLYRVLTHPNAQVVGQNLLYDSQYTYRWWHFVPRVFFDTMTAHHVCYPGLQKKLDFQASMYSKYYVQWKKDRGAWKEGG